MRSSTRILGFVLAALAAFWFTVVNAGERVEVDLVILRIVAPLPLVVFGSVLVGMLTVMLIGLRADLHTRRMLAKYREVLEGEDPTRARLQGTDSPEPASASRSEEEVSSAP